METNDRPLADAGKNFGRFSRTGIMDAYLTSVKNYPLCGIRAVYWLDFFKVFQEHATNAEVLPAIERLRGKIRSNAVADGESSARAESALRVLSEIETLFLG